MKPKVFVSRGISQRALEQIEAVCHMEIWEGEMPPPYAILTDRVRGADGLLCMLTDRIDDALMQSAGGSLKVISQMAVGYNNIDVKAAQARGILLGNTPGVLTDATADLTFALLLAAARRIVEGVEYIRAGEWRTWSPNALLGRDVSNATIGIVGFGRIGQAVARRARAFNMRVIAYSHHLTQEQADLIGVDIVDFETLLRESDYVSLHVPLTDDTYHLMNTTSFALMKPTAILINTARGAIVDQTALYEALTDGVIGGAALDVTDPEPMRDDDPLLMLNNVIILPHIGSATQGTRDLMAQMAVDNLLAGVLGKPLPHAIKA
jgi:glyoxylate reductase